MIRTTVELQGLEAVVRELEKRRMDVVAGVEQICHAGATVIREAAEANAPGSIAEDIQQETTARRGTRVEVSVGPSRKNKIARFVEYGTRPHLIPKAGKRRKKKALLIQGRFAAYARHPGARPRPYLRPAFDHNTGAAEDAMARETKRVVRA